MKQFKFILFIALLIGSKSFGYDLWVTNGIVGTDGLPKKITVIPQAVWGIGNTMLGQTRQDVGVKEDVFDDGTKITYVTGAGGIGNKKNGSKFDYLKTI